MADSLSSSSTVTLEPPTAPAASDIRVIGPSSSKTYLQIYTTHFLNTELENFETAINHRPNLPNLGLHFFRVQFITPRPLL